MLLCAVSSRDIYLFRLTFSLAVGVNFVTTQSSSLT